MVYIIDDDRDFAECVARMLRKFSGSKVEIFSNGIEATMAMNDGVPDLIFLDVLLS